MCRNYLKQRILTLIFLTWESQKILGNFNLPICFILTVNKYLLINDILLLLFSVDKILLEASLYLTQIFMF